MLFEASDQLIAELAHAPGVEILRIHLDLTGPGILYRLYGEGPEVVLMEITDPELMLGTVVTTDAARQFIKTKRRNVELALMATLNFPLEWDGGELSKVTKIVRLT